MKVIEYENKYENEYTLFDRLDGLKMNYDYSEAENEIVTIDYLVNRQHLPNYYKYDKVIDYLSYLIEDDILYYGNTSMNEKRLNKAIDYIKTDLGGRIPNEWTVEDLYSVGNYRENIEFAYKNEKQYCNNLMIDYIKEELKSRGISEISEEQYEHLKNGIKKAVDKIVNEPRFEVMLDESNTMINGIQKELDLETIKDNEIDLTDNWNKDKSSENDLER